MSDNPHMTKAQRRAARRAANKSADKPDGEITQNADSPSEDEQDGEDEELAEAGQADDQGVEDVKITVTAEASEDDPESASVTVAAENGGTIIVEGVPIENVASIMEEAPSGDLDSPAAKASLDEDEAHIREGLAKLGLDGPVDAVSPEEVVERAQELPDEISETVIEKPVGSGTEVTTIVTTRRLSKSMQDHEPDSKHKLPREGTDRRKVLELMSGEFTPDEIAAEMRKINSRFDAKYVYAHAYCTFRDCGIGYRTTEEGKLEALFPKVETADAE